jgi:heme a synthase
MEKTKSKAVGIWLMIGVGLVFIQVIIGGITRLTGSGLSITKWEIVTGTLPPLNQGDWENEFDKYKDSPQYKLINKGMSLSEFKFIYFWEYFHRLWARMMGFVFIIPFVLFLKRKLISKSLLKHLITVMLLSALTGSFGWIMVKSGLQDKPWVSPYKLTMHLSLALLVLGYLWWLAMSQLFPGRDNNTKPPMIKVLYFIGFLMILQIVLGGMMSGLKAGLYYPSFPKMYGEWVPKALYSLTDYDSSLFTIAFVQFFHRLTGSLLFIISGIWVIRNVKFKLHPAYQKSIYLLFAAITLQVIIGIITVFKFKSGVPVSWGVMHQAGAMLVLLATLAALYFSRFTNKNNKAV